MNLTIKQLLNRKSVRNFTGESVKEEDLKLIFEAAQRCPTSINAQQISLVYTRDKEKIAKIAELCRGQKQVETADVFVTFVIDFNRTNHAIESLGKKQIVEKSAEGIVVGAIDAGIMLSSLQTAAESLGYGTTAIGAVRCEPDTFIEILGLPPKTYPVVGSTIGIAKEHVKDEPLKPRVPLDSFVFEDKYDESKVKEGVEQYELDMKNFREENNMDYLISYKEQTASFYENYYMPQVKSSFENKGLNSRIKNNMETQKKVALVTGANQGIGFATVQALLKNGFTVVLTARDEAKGLEAKEKLSKYGSCHFILLDITNQQSINKAFDYVDENFGKLDVLVNNAAINYDTWHDVVSANLEEVEQTLNTNIMGAWRVTQSFVSLLKKSHSGRVVNVSSGAGNLNSQTGSTPAYSLSKLALNGLTMQFANSLKKDGILVNAICPGWVRTSMGGMGAPKSAQTASCSGVYLL